MKSALKASAAMALLAAHTPAYAQEAFDLGEITLFSSSVPTELDKTGTTTEVLSEEDIAKQGQQEVGDKLNALPGVSLTQDGPTGTKQSVFVRGLPSKYVPVFFDGIDLTDTTAAQTAFDWGGFGAAGI
ncbi:TonB-dependent receptor, partial [Lentibacter sp.]|uniref:TonB-dependent receptor n=1 Tax=Lentibacter sp. TaxID=2024994 RepID=UPI003F6B90C1